MIETAARAERLEASIFTAPFYKWEVAGKPVTVAIPLAMIDHMEQEAVTSFRSLSSLGSEIGGILLGSAAPGAASAVTVISYEPVSCDYSLGPLYRLSEADLAELDRTIAHARNSGLMPVGFYRSHTRKGLSFDADDRNLLDLRFADPHCVALLIRPFASKTSVGGIFIRENGEVHGETSYLEFPFRSSQLTAPSRPAPAPGTRAQIVPIATRREPAPMELRAPLAPPPAPERETIGTLEPERAPAPVQASVAMEAASEAASEAGSGASSPVAEKKSRRVYLYVAAIVAVIGLILGAYFGGMRRAGRLVPPAGSASLTLRAEQGPSELLLTWNRDSDAIRNASRAVLEISDGPQHENVEMDLAQLRNGSIIYSPATADVVFKMDVTGKDGGKLASESVRVLHNRPSSMPVDDPKSQPVVQPAATAENSVPTATDAVAEEDAKPAGPPRVTKPFNTESLSQRLRPATPTDLPDAPMVARSNTALPTLPLNLSSEPPVAPAPPPPAVEKAPSGGQIQTAQLLSRKDPEYPKIARDSGAKGTVRLIATVGTDGKVKSVKAVAGHPLLVRPATEAVMQWIYRPTYLNGVAVETQTEIVLNFVNER